MAQRQYTSSFNLHVLNASVGLCGLSSSIDTPTSSLIINSSSPSIFPIQGVSEPASFVNVLNERLRWHGHDPVEIQEHADRCMEETIKHLESAGWSKDSVKIIGILTFISFNRDLCLYHFAAYPGITNQRETAVAWSRQTGKPLCEAIVWADSRTKHTVTQFEQKLKETGIQVKPGEWRKGDDGIEALRQMCVRSFLSVQLIYMS